MDHDAICGGKVGSFIDHSFLWEDGEWRESGEERREERKGNPNPRNKAGWIIVKEDKRKCPIEISTPDAFNLKVSFTKRGW